MTILTSQAIHSRNWLKCPRCDGGAIFTAKDRRQGSMCAYCDNKGEVPRLVDRKAADSSSFYEQQLGA
jgi:hypothetical protein